MDEIEVRSEHDFTYNESFCGAGSSLTGLSKSGLEKISFDEARKVKLFLPSRSISGKKIVAIDRGAFSELVPEESRTIIEISQWPERLVSIEQESFMETPIVVSSVFPDSLVTIGDRAFCRSSLDSIVLPRNVLYIGEFAFYSNKLTQIRLPACLVEMKKAAFAENKIFTILSPFPQSLEIFDECVFGYNKLFELPSFGGVRRVFNSHCFVGNTITSWPNIPEGSILKKESLAKSGIKDLVQCNGSVTYENLDGYFVTEDFPTGRKGREELTRLLKANDIL